MAKFIDNYLKLMDILDIMVRKLLIVIVSLMTMAVIFQVVSRYVLKNPLPWTEELARYLMVWMSFIGGSCVIKKWDHIYVDFFINMMKQKPRKMMLLAQKFVILGLLVYSFYLCLTVFSRVSSFQRTAVMGISMLWPQSGMTVGFLLMILQNIGIILNDTFSGEEA
jgi:TRAP-type C4-dicarboxylate transport system permease small subunit